MSSSETGTTTKIGERISAAIDREKPLFDVAQYFLTVAAWWSGIALLAHALAPKTWSIFGFPYILIPAALFGLALIARCSDMTEKIVFIAMEESFGARLQYTHPLRVAVTLLLLLVQFGLVLVLYLGIGTAFGTAPAPQLPPTP